MSCGSCLLSHPPCIIIIPLLGHGQYFPLRRLLRPRQGLAKPTGLVRKGHLAPLRRTTHQKEPSSKGILIIKKEPSLNAKLIKRNTHIKKEHSLKGTLIKRNTQGLYRRCCLLAGLVAFLLPCSERNEGLPQEDLCTSSPCIQAPQRGRLFALFVTKDY